MSTPCDQCGRAAMWELGPPGNRFRLCLDCYVKLTRAQTSQLELLQRQVDSTEATMYEIAGLPVPQRLMPPAPQVHAGPVNVSNIDIRDSSIGVLNTGSLSIVSSCISVLARRGKGELGKAISELTRAVIDNTQLAAQAKNEVLELISAVASESIQPEGRRRPSVLRALINSLAAAIGTIGGLISIWDRVRPVLESVLLP